MPAGGRLPRRGRPPRRAPTPLTGRHTHYQERRAALFTLARQRQLARRCRGSSSGCSSARCCGCSASCRPLRRGGARRARRACCRVHSRPGQVRGCSPAAARSRAGGDAARRAPPARAVVAALPPRARRRHRLSPRPRPTRPPTSPSDAATPSRGPTPGTREERRTPADDEDDASSTDTGLVARFFTNPVALVLVLSCLLAFVAAREAFGSIAGGALARCPRPRPTGGGCTSSAGTRSGTGTDVPARRTSCRSRCSRACCCGNTGAVVVGVMLLAVPIAAWGAWRLLQGRRPPRRPARAAPVAAGLGRADLRARAGDVRRVGRGPVRDGGRRPRCCPGLAHAALGFVDPTATGAGGPRGGRRCCSPSARPSCPGSGSSPVLVAAVVLGTAAFISSPCSCATATLGPAGRGPRRQPAAAGAVVVPAAHDGSAAACCSSPAGSPSTRSTFVGLRPVGSTTRRAGVAGRVLALLALLALVPARPACRCWPAGWSPSLPRSVRRPRPRPARAAGRDDAAEPGPVRRDPAGQRRGRRVSVRCLPAPSRRPRTRSGSAGSRSALAVVAAVVPLGGMLWWLVRPGDRADGIPSIPRSPPTWSRARSSVPSTVCWSSAARSRTASPTASVAGTASRSARTRSSRSPTRTSIHRVVQELVSSPGPEVVAALGDAGSSTSCCRARRRRVSALLDATAGLDQASAEDRATRAWRVDRPLDPDAVAGSAGWWRTALLVAAGRSRSSWRSSWPPRPWGASP